MTTTTTLSPIADECEVHELLVALRAKLARAEQRAAADPTNPAFAAHVTMARAKLDAMQGLKREVPKVARPVVAVRYARQAVPVSTLPEGTRFCLACNPTRQGKVVRHGIGSTVVRYGSGREVSVGGRTFTAAGEAVTIARTSSVRVAE